MLVRNSSHRENCTVRFDGVDWEKEEEKSRIRWKREKQTKQRQLLRKNRKKLKEKMEELKAFLGKALESPELPNLQSFIMFQLIAAGSPPLVAPVWGDLDLSDPQQQLQWMFENFGEWGRRSKTLMPALEDWKEESDQLQAAGPTEADANSDQLQAGGQDPPHGDEDDDDDHLNHREGTDQHRSPAGGDEIAAEQEDLLNTPLTDLRRFIPQMIQVTTIFDCVFYAIESGVT